MKKLPIALILLAFACSKSSPSKNAGADNNIFPDSSSDASIIVTFPNKVKYTYKDYETYNENALTWTVDSGAASGSAPIDGYTLFGLFNPQHYEIYFQSYRNTGLYFSFSAPYSLNAQNYVDTIADGELRLQIGDSVFLATSAIVNLQTTQQLDSADGQWISGTFQISCTADSLGIGGTNVKNLQSPISITATFRSIPNF
ncbi:MAG TPA: hypothetical protein VKR53_12015 [Puia sp.]|nr:hypothetical protein [Puia sp.]